MKKLYLMNTPCFHYIVTATIALVFATFVFFMAGTKADAFACRLDLTCFSQCVDTDNNDIEYCKIKCEKCGW